MSSLRNSTQESHLAAARAAVIDLGWRRTTLTEVARRAGVSRMTIYRHWEDRDRLLADLMTREWVDILCSSEINHEDDHSLDGLVDAALATVEGVRTSPLMRRIIELDAEMLLPYLLERTGRTHHAVLAMLEPRIARVQAAGELRAGDPSLIARSLVLMLQGLLLSADLMQEGTIDRSEIVAAYREILINGLAPKTVSPTESRAHS